MRWFTWLRDWIAPAPGGIFRPVILIPESWFDLRSDEQLRAILAHEQAHVDGRDMAWDLLCRAAFACCWFHPFVWYLQRSHRLACEYVSDVIAADTVDDLPLYRRWLAQWVIAPHQPDRVPTTVIAGTFSMAKQSMMLRCLEWLKQEYRGVCPSRLKMAGLLMLIMLVGATVSVVNVTRSVIAAPPQQADQTAATVNDEEDEVPTSNKQLVVRVENGEGEPIQNATVLVNQWGYADHHSKGTSNDIQQSVDTDGEVTFDIPPDAINVGFSVSADGYGDHPELVAIKDRVTVVLKRGRRIRVRVIDEQGNEVSSAMLIVENARH
ncbi:MAG: M56 family metallopeptidase [Planctomycetaceae bacterium]|nr:M56 family metallopeptidase [Planctomycetaceae bacterium]